MEEKFIAAWEKARQDAQDLGVRMRPVDRRFTELFTDEQANEALQRLLEAGYYL